LIVFRPPLLQYHPSLTAPGQLAPGPFGWTNGDGRALEAALAELTVADWKHRLVFVLTRAAIDDARAARWSTARTRAKRALGIAELLGRPSEIVLARALLVRCARALDEHDEELEQRKAVDALPLATVAANVRKIAEALDETF